MWKFSLQGLRNFSKATRRDTGTLASRSEDLILPRIHCLKLDPMDASATTENRWGWIKFPPKSPIHHPSVKSPTHPQGILVGCPGRNTNFNTLPVLLLLLLSHSAVSDSLQRHGLQHTRLPWPSLSPGACSNSCPLSQWCHPTTSFSVALFSSRPLSFPAPGSFPMSQHFKSGGQSIEA